MIIPVRILCAVGRWIPRNLVCHLSWVVYVITMGRTFSEPRNPFGHSQLFEHNANRALVGEKIVLVDDSIVRNNWLK